MDLASYKMIRKIAPGEESKRLAYYALEIRDMKSKRER